MKTHRDISVSEIFRCDVGCDDFLVIEVDEEWFKGIWDGTQSGAIGCIDVTQGIKHINWRDRFKVAWKLLRFGFIHQNSVALTPFDLTRLHEAIAPFCVPESDSDGATP